MSKGMWRVRLSAADTVILALCGIFTSLALLFNTRVPLWAALTAANAATAAGVCLLASDRPRKASRIGTAVRDWYVAPLLYFAYREACYLVNAVHLGRRYDGLLIAADRWLFRMNPTRWIDRFAHPWVTEVFQLAYTTFFLLFLIVGFELYRHRDRELYHRFVFVCAYGLALSYFGYFIAPAEGPRFTLYDFASTESELPGLWLTHALRLFINGGASIGPAGETTALSATCDVFPSGHTMMTLALVWWSLKHRLRVRYFILALGSLLICATLYLHYHYAVDLLAGAVFAGVLVLTWQSVHGLVERLLPKPDCGVYDQS